MSTLLLFALPIFVAASLIDPGGTGAILRHATALIGIALVMSVVFGWPTLLGAAIQPRLRSSRLAAVVEAGVSTFGMVAAMMALLLAAMAYSEPGSGVDVSQRWLLPYAPTVGFYLAGSAVALYFGFGLTGFFTGFVSDDTLIKAGTILGLVLFLLGFGFVRGVPWLVGPPSAQIADDTGSGYATPSAGSNEATAPALPAHIVIGSDGNLRPADGYQFVNPSDPADFAVTWTPGLRSRRYPHLVASPIEGKWLSDPGYAFVSDIPGDYTVRWTPDLPSGQHPHVVAGNVEGQWVPAAGYTWVITPHRSDFRVTWTPGRRSDRRPDLVAGPNEGEWVAASRDRGTVSLTAPARASVRAAQEPEDQVFAASRPVPARIAGDNTLALTSKPREPSTIDVGGSSSPQVGWPIPLNFILVNRSLLPIVSILVKPTERSTFGVPEASPDIGAYGQTYVSGHGGQIEVRFLTSAPNQNACYYDVFARLQTGEPIRMTHLNLCETRAVVFNGHSFHVVARRTAGDLARASLN